jgi:methylmalonyl-CoA mutase
MMGDIQQYFIDNRVRNFYSVSISGYHIAEAGANPDHPAGLHAGERLHLRRVLPLARDAHRRLRAEPVLLLQQRLDPEYSVIGRVARRIWAKAIKSKYGGNERSRSSSTTSRPRADRCTPRRSRSTTSARRCRRSMRPTTTATRCTRTPTTRPSPRRPRRACAARWRSSSSSTRSWAWRRTRTRCRAFIIDELTELVEQAVLAEFRASRSAAACSARWSACTSARRSRKSRCTTSR